MIRYVLVLLCLGTLLTEGRAFHIIGGEVTYQCLGPGTVTGTNIYQFEMYIYIDCDADEPNASPLDPSAQIGIYRGDEFSSFIVDGFNVNLGSQRLIDPPTIECLIPPDGLCVRQGFYTWTVQLPTLTESYHLTYQRCCRNSTITNIVNPNAVGASYTMEINPLAQSECNNTPIFNQFPPTIICINEPLSFDHGAMDVDGDSLVYSFVAPVNGGSPDNPIPIPLGPPYSPISFIEPVFSPTFPLGEGTIDEPGVQIDSLTGVITGFPKTKGQFVVGVRVEEYRRGELIGRLTRDFQFNVESCESTVIASLEADEIIGDRSFAITSCGEQTVTFENTSTLDEQIFSYQWEFTNKEGELFTSDIRNATIAFPDTGTYEGKMYLNRNSVCEDSATIAVRILPETIADYSFDYDTCVVGPVSFTNLSTTEANSIETYEWDFGGLGTSSASDPEYTFPQPSTQPVRLTIVDNNGCESVSSQEIVWQPAPQTVVVQPNTFLGCEPADIEFVNLSFPIDSTYTFNWDFGDGGTSSELNPSHHYESSGVYDVSLEIISPIGCSVEGSFNSLIRVEQGPKADFDFTPLELSSVQRTAQFTDESIDASSWFWNFGNEGFSTLEDPNYTFQDTGLQEVRLIITKDNGCQDTIVKQLDVVPMVRFHMPNAFTPNNDGKNETFFGKGVLTGMRDFQFTIWNRWGEQVFSTNNPDEGWNGRKNNDGANSPVGSYPYLITYREPRGNVVRLKGHANLIR